MSTPIKNPAFAAGINGSSGSVQTGQLTFVLGGGRSFSQFSGNLTSQILSGGGDQLIYSGAGRLDTFFMHTQMNSGHSATIYDAAVATSGGPFPLSGHKILLVTPPTFAGGYVSGVPLPSQVFVRTNVGMPFQSGLCMNVRSGVPGFTLSFTPEVSQNFPGT